MESRRAEANLGNRLVGVTEVYVFHGGVLRGDLGASPISLQPVPATAVRLPNCCVRDPPRDSAQNDAITLIDEIGVMAKADALEICGEKRDSVLLVKNHLAGLSVADYVLSHRPVIAARTTVLFELRQYKIRDGYKDSWVRLMEDEIIPFQVAQGMVILGSFTGDDDDSIYVWIRRFKDEAERERLYRAVYESDHWKEKIAPRIPEMMDREAINVIRLEPTLKSPIQ